MKYGLYLALIAACATVQTSHADVVRDGSIGPGVGTQPGGPNFVIDESMGQLNGTNLFHSFSRFDLNSGQSASFTAASPVDNVISRITGGTLSTIDGGISSAIPGANLFLINPAGLIFGPNATVNVNGSFYVSTATYLRFADNSQLLTGSTGSPVLTIAAPSAFGFIGAPSAAINMNGTKITVAASETIGMVANGIHINDDGNFPGFANPTLSAPNGNLNLQSVASAGEVAVDVNLMNSFQAPAQGAQLQLSNSLLDNSGSSPGGIWLRASLLQMDASILRSNMTGGGSAGDIVVDAQQFIGNGVGGFVSSTSGAGSGGGIVLTADTIALNPGFALNASTEALATGPAGDIYLRGRDRISLYGGNTLVAVSTESRGVGRAGDITIDAPQVDIDNAIVEANTLFAGDAGNISIEARQLNIVNGGRVWAANQGSGAGSTIRLSASESIHIQGPVEPEIADIVSSETFADGSAGSIFVNTPQLTIDEAEVKVSSKGSGDAGVLDVRADRIELINGGQLSATAQFAGNAGNINIVANESLLISGADATGVSSGVFTDSRVTASGDAGDIHITAPQVTIDGEGQLLSDTRGSGAGGTVNLQLDRLSMTRGAAISALSTGVGDAGNIDIVATDRISVSGGSAITTESEVSDGGNISMTAGDYVLLRDSRVAANVNDGVGGNIVIGADSVVLDQTPVVAQAGDGQGGAIMINANKYFNDNSPVSASAGPAGISGSVDINAPEVDVSASLTRLKTEFVDAAALIASICAADKQADGGRFVVSRRRGLPSTIEGLPLPLVNGPVIRVQIDESQPLIDAQLLSESEAARRSTEDGNVSTALDHLHQARQRLQSVTDDRVRVYSIIHLARSHALLAAASETMRQQQLLLANDLFEQAKNMPWLARDARAASFVWGNQALLYGQQHRYDDALYLLRKAQNFAEQSAAAEALYLWLWQQGRMLWMQGRAQPAVFAYQQAVEVLNASRQDALVRERSDQAFFLTRIAPVYRDLTDALLQSVDRVPPQQRQSLLNIARQVMNAFRAAELRNYFLDPCISDQDRNTVALDQVSEHAAIVYPMIMPDRLEVLVSVAGDLSRYRVDVDQTQLIAQLRRYRIALQQADSGHHLRYGKTLYQWLVAPYQSLLQQQQVDTLVFVMDGALRTIPMAALHDGERYLVDRYALATSVGLDLVQPEPLNRGRLRMLMAGISEPLQGFPALPYVPEEFDSLKRMFGGEVLLDKGFKLGRFRTALDDEQPSLVHLATHAKFSSDADSSFLLAYDGRITMDRMADYIGQRKRQQAPLELLVLSACDTAIGDDRAALGLAGVGVKAGARSAVGSLWSIPDSATYELMSRFYRQLKQPNVSRAQALQRAQQSLHDDERFSHPFNWAAFMMINNWL